MIKEISLKGRKIIYNLERKNVKNINLRIKANHNVYVSANVHVTDDVIAEFLKEKADYILRALDYYADIAKYSPQPKLYVDGESFRILGHDRRLKVIQGKRNVVESDESYITLTVKDVFDPELKKKSWTNGLKITAKKCCLMFVKGFILNFRNMALHSRKFALEIWFHAGEVANLKEVL